MIRKKADLRRTSRGRSAQDYTIVVAYDGERTEDFYFRSWKQIVPFNRLNIQPTFVKSGGNPLHAVRACKKKLKSMGDYAEFWCVCDADDASQADITLAMQEAVDAGIRLCLSVRCFEVWIALHYNLITAPVNTSDDALRLVRENHPSYARPTKVVNFIELFYRTEQAIQNGEQLELFGLSNPKTNVHNLVRKIFQNLR